MTIKPTIRLGIFNNESGASLQIYTLYKYPMAYNESILTIKRYYGVPQYNIYICAS